MGARGVGRGTGSCCNRCSFVGKTGSSAHGGNGCMMWKNLMPISHTRKNSQDGTFYVYFTTEHSQMCPGGHFITSSTLTPELTPLRMLGGHCGSPLQRWIEMYVKRVDVMSHEFYLD